MFIKHKIVLFYLILESSTGQILRSGTARSRFLPNDEDAHEENHDEEDPHEESVHHLSDLLPFCPFGACGPLLSETVGNIFDIANQLGVNSRYATAVAAEHTWAKGHSRARRWRFCVFRTAGKLLVFRAAGDLLVFFTAVTCSDFPIRAFIFPRCIAGEVAPVVSSDVVLGLHSGMVLRLGGLRSGVFVTLPVLLATVAARFTVGVNVGAEVLVTDVLLGEVGGRRGRGGGGGGAVLTHFIHKENLGHVVDDEDFCPVGDWFGLRTAEVDVHDEDGERCGGCDHGHSGNVVLTCKNTDRSMLLEKKIL